MTTLHRELGPGLLERPYKNCFAHEMAKSGLRFRREVPLRVIYDGIDMDCGYYADFIVEETIVVELKAVKALDFVFVAQTVSYLRLSGCPLGLLINFNTLLLKDGIRRVYRDNPAKESIS